MSGLLAGWTAERAGNGGSDDPLEAKPSGVDGGSNDPLLTPDWLMYQWRSLSWILARDRSTIAR